MGHAEDALPFELRRAKLENHLTSILEAALVECGDDAAAAEASALSRRTARELLGLAERDATPSSSSALPPPPPFSERGRTSYWAGRWDPRAVGVSDSVAALRSSDHTQRTFTSCTLRGPPLRGRV